MAVIGHFPKLAIIAVVRLFKAGLLDAINQMQQCLLCILGHRPNDLIKLFGRKTSYLITK
ncbi:MAG: hypothetical protein WCR02_11550 [Sphaerochaetaceae bacterium]